MRVSSLGHALISLAVTAACAAASAAVVDFEDLTVPSSGFFNGYPGSPLTNQTVTVPWESAGVSFSNVFGNDTTEDYSFDYWFGFAYSNVVNTTDPSFTNQYASYPGGGFGSSTYAVAYADGATVSLPVATTVAGFRIANTTYSALTMLQGDEYGFSNPLAAGGWFTTTATGKLAGSTTGSATFYLADLRGDSPPGVLATWAWFDLTALGTVDEIEFSFDGSDKSPPFGLNTPAYFAMDNLTVTAVPEPGTMALVAAAALVGLGNAWRRGRRRHAA